MQNPETLATLGTHDTGQDTKKQQQKQTKNVSLWYFGIFTPG